MTDLREAAYRPMCECPKCGRAHWKLADSPPSQRPTILLRGVDLREAIARAIGYPDATNPDWDIADAVLAAIEAAGWQCVPKEPTREMMKELVGPAGYTSIPLADAYRAMLAAAPKPGGDK
jgi:hypothetical protein